ncbi:MAG: sugar ABC transporter permease [Chloroflexi bacterium]|jgi:inositol-phosphate transport system permease protein|nr:sugar ABC transporter permease [Chloroflexota bacterium]MCO6445141.1 sugar ABC transporter permease [Anaerolineae bacterium]MDL1914666.1 sugar ABC transporter permease [Anaerolineae bacterium CFX4]OQY81501.1 MAG: ABC transporter permease [Anaerolineae bacterium UTCFX5]MCC6565207.1 sugar ABC transporter permease [Chloroflexota bacterium]
MNTSARARTAPTRPNLTAYAFLAPVAILVVLFFIIPALLVIYISMTDLATANFTSDVGQMTFIGLKNYETLFSDPYARKIFFNTVFYVLVTLSLFNVGGALVVALLTAHINRRAGFFFRALWLLPRLMTSTVYILMWERMVADPPYGILNQLFGVAGYGTAAFNTNHIWTFVILVNGIIGISFGMIIFTSAIESISKDIMNASLVDGSTAMQRIRYVILPLMRWPLLFVLSYQTLSLLTSYEEILLFTNGGPGVYQTEVWALTAFHRALSNYFGNAQWGYGSAFAVVLVIVGIVLAILYLRIFRFRELVSEPKIENL